MYAFESTHTIMGMTDKFYTYSWYYIYQNSIGKYGQYVFPPTKGSLSGYLTGIWLWELNI